MFEASTTPTIEVRIGRQTRLYHAFITTAPAVLDSPSTLTLYAGPVKHIATLALDDLPPDVASADIPSRLVLIDTTELVWQRERCCAQGYRLTPADSVVVGTTLQSWLWQRLRNQTDGNRERRRTAGQFCLTDDGNSKHQRKERPYARFCRAGRARGFGTRSRGRLDGSEHSRLRSRRARVPDAHSARLTE
jgi:hypothetical protein